MNIKTTALTAALAVVLGTTMHVPVARAQIPVTDVASIVQRAIEAAAKIAKLVAQLEQMKAQLEQAKATYDNMTGDRGMRWLMSSENYRRLPTDWKDTINMIDNQGGSYRIRHLAKDILENMNDIDPSLFEDVDNAYGKLAGKEAKQAATYQAQQATQFDDVAQRFNTLKQLIDKISTAEDQKAILELNARITAQQAMLQNEVLKMRALAQVRASQKDLQEAQRQQAFVKESRLPAAQLTPIQWGHH